MLLLAALAGCASVPENAVSERLDERTGTTVTTMQKPIELVSTEPRGSNSDPFAYLAPFETNRMGRRELFLWIAVPDERGGASAAGAEGAWNLLLRLTIRDRTLERKLAAVWSEKEDVLTAETFAELRFSDFGIQPYSTMLGAIRNDDRFHLYVNVVAHPAR